MTVSKIRLPDNTEHDIRAKYLIQSSSSDATSAEFSARTVTEDAVANIQKIYGNTVVVSDNPVSNNATAIVTTGKNLFDIDTVLANKSGITKTAAGWSGTSNNFAAIGHIWENTTGYTGRICVYMKATANSASGSFRPQFYYTNGRSSSGPSISGTSIDTYVLSTDGWIVDYIIFTYGSNRTNVIEKLSISIADDSYNGTYEPYQAHQIDLNIPTLTGKLNGAGSSVIVFTNGMQSNGTTRDELTATSAIKRIADDNSVLSTPQEYILDNALQLQYPVVAGGTEMVLPTTGTAPMKMDVIYGNAADAAATMSQNFISVDSMKGFLAALGTQMGGTWSIGYGNGKHTFTFTSN